MSFFSWQRLSREENNGKKSGGVIYGLEVLMSAGGSRGQSCRLLGYFGEPKKVLSSNDWKH